MSEALVLRSDDVATANLHSADNGGVRLYLLGGFELRCDGRSILLVPGSQRLVAFLALQERHLPRTYVAETLWADVPDRRAWGNLRSALWRLGPLRDRVVEQAGDHLRLCPAVIVDMREVQRIAALLIANSPLDDEPFDQPFDQRAFLGELLPGWFDDWILSERERHRQLGLHALELICDRLTIDGRYCQAVQAGLAAASAEPLRESAHRSLICAHLAEGNVVEAIRQYRVFEHILREELDLEPSDRLKALIAGGRRA